MPANDPMAQLYGRLGSVGFPRKYLREIVLPGWWDDEISHNPAGYAEGLLLLSKNLGLDLASLQNEAVPVGLRNLGPCKFKKAASTDEGKLTVTAALAAHVAQLAASATPQSTVPLLDSAIQIRNLILQAGAPWIGLSHLVDYCWAASLPVLHISAFPPGHHKMDGLAWVGDGQRAIVLCKNMKYSAWLLFVLAHEIGHLVLRHLTAGSVLVDEEIDRQSTDREEQEANAFALELLTGNSQCQVFPVGASASARALAKAAKEAGTAEHIDPGHLILNCAFQMGGNFFAIANAALALIEPNACAPEVLRSYSVANLDKAKLPEETYEFLLRVTKAEDAS